MALGKGWPDSSGQEQWADLSAFSRGQCPKMDQKLMELRIYALCAFIPPGLTQHGAHEE